MFRQGGSDQWVQAKKLVPIDAAAEDQFGRAIDIDGDYAVVGTLGKDLIAKDAGMAYVFAKDPMSGWVEQSRLVMNLGAADDEFGYSVTLSGNDVLVGAPGHGAAALSAGAVCAFRLSGADPLAGCPTVISLAEGGEQGFEIDAGAEHAEGTYWLLGSLSGFAPSLAVGLHTVPLVPDFYTECTVVTPNTAPLADSMGILDAEGRATARFSLPAGTSSALAGTVVHHACLVFSPSDELEFVSNPVAVELR